MKQKFLVFFLTVYSFANSQNNFGTVEYKIADVMVPVKEGMKQNELVQSIIDAAKQHKFTLSFSTNQSEFTINNILNDESINQEFNNMAKIAYSTTDDFFIDIEKKELIKRTEDNTLLKSAQLIYNWEITKESKMIDNYLCYKAECKITYTASNKLSKQRLITAWFAPSLPFSFGPIEFYGLPGLILELHKGYTTYLATKISLSDKEIIIDYPKGKTITEEEYENKILSRN